MGRARFDVETEVNAPASVLYAHLVEVENQLGLQPLLTRIDVTSRAHTPDGEPRTGFETVERFVLAGPIAYENRIRVECVGLEPGRRVGFTAVSRPGLVVRSEFVLEERVAGGGTRVLEHVAIEGPWWAVAVARVVARRAHVRLLANLKARIEASEAAAGTGQPGRQG